MQRLTGELRSALTSVSSGEVELVFVTMSHDSFISPIRVVSEGENGVSFYNGRPINYVHNGYTFLGCPFSFDLIPDDDQPPRARFSIVDAERRVGLFFLSLVETVRIDVEVLKASDFSEDVDDDNARSPLATPGILYRALYLRLQDISGDAIAVQGNLGSFDTRSNPWPKYRATQTLLPGLYRR